MIKPLRNCVLIEAEEAPKQTASGLYMSESWKTLPPYGVVKAIGPDVKDVKVKDRVLFNRYAAMQLEEQDRLITEGDVLAVVTKEKKNAKTD